MPLIDFDRIVPGDFEDAVQNHMGTPNTSVREWARLAKESRAFSRLAGALSKAHKLPINIVAALICVGVEIGFYLGSSTKGRVIDIYRDL
jgi:hypothetical protein